jgi:divalent metal cation (Fe/Co/Zn/Cd) transporter
MKTAWIDDLLSLIAPIAFLVAGRISIRPPNERFPYGYHRAVSIAFLCASLSLCTMGGWLLIDAVTKLLKAEHPTIGGVHLFGQTIWLG